MPLFSALSALGTTGSSLFPVLGLLKTGLGLLQHLNSTVEAVQHFLLALLELLRGGFASFATLLTFALLSK